MEALFSDFHIGDVGMGIMGGVVAVTLAIWWYVARVQEQKKAL